MRELILASGSPRRRELLEQIKVPFRVMVSDAEETVTDTDPGQVVKALAARKAIQVAKEIEEGLVLGADTVVSVDGEILGKPKNREDARQMLEKLQGRAHSVFTGVALVEKQKNDTAQSDTTGGPSDSRVLENFYRETRVHVHQMSDQEIENYLDTGDAFDKAGSYGIQGPFAAFVDGIEGDYNNVVGLPVSAVYQALARVSTDRRRH